jgi:transposase
MSMMTGPISCSWALVAPLISPAKRGGRPRSVDIREVLNAIFYVLWSPPRGVRQGR